MEQNIGTTDETFNTNTVDLTQVERLKNPFEITVPTNRTVKIVTTVMDSDEPWNADDEIRTISNFVVPFSTAWVGDNWKVASKTSSNPYMNFTVQYKLTGCDNYFAGAGCNTYCKQDIVIYTCNQTSGEKICDSSRDGVECDLCASDYYPEGNCSVYCKPEQSRYNCSDQGDKICQGNWIGTECDTCKTDFYGPNCQVYCQETSNFTCDDNGSKDCKAEFYPDNLCNVHCAPIPHVFNCNVTTGDKICLGNITGVNCDTCTKDHYPEGNYNVFCTDVTGKYTCNDQGDKDCQGNWNGTECDTCKNNYFGLNCTKYCVEQSGYKCNGQGDKARNAMN